MKIFKWLSKTALLGVLLVVGIILAALFSFNIGDTFVKADGPDGPFISFSPPSPVTLGEGDTSVNITLQRFPPKTNVTLKYNGMDLTVAQTGLNGDVIIPMPKLGLPNVGDITITANYDGAEPVLGHLTILPASTLPPVPQMSTVEPVSPASPTISSLPNITVSPPSGPVGTSIEIKGTEFPAKQDIIILFDGRTEKIVPVKTSKDFDFKMKIPASTVGMKTILINDGKTGTQIAETFFNVTPTTDLGTSLGDNKTGISLLTRLSGLKSHPWFIIAGALLGLVMVIILFGKKIWHFIIEGREDDSGYQGTAKVVDKNMEKELVYTRNELNNLKKKYQSYENLEHQVPVLKQQYNQIAGELRGRFPQEMGSSFTSLLSVPAPEYGALAEQVKILRAFSAYFNAETEKTRTLKSDCLRLATQIKEDEPAALSATLLEVINSAQLEGLKALKPVLERMHQQGDKTGISIEVKNELVKLEKSLESIRDYSYRLIPSRLIEFANNLIKEPALARENAVREKTVLQIINLINEYLKH